jgi:predicted DCC family thiol-disulfide oxidoreductase YuxK
MPNPPIILFDGVCNLCNNSVQFVIKHDTDNKFMFAALQSPTGQALLQQYNLPQQELNSFVLIKDEKVYLKSTGALNVAKNLNGPVKLLYGFIIVPEFIRNAVYNFIAKNRYKWFGKKESCMIPTPALQSRFLN